MYVHVSKYRNTARVRLLQKVRIDGSVKTRLVKHIGTARNKDELEILKELAKKDLIRLRYPDQLRFGIDDIPSAGIYALSDFYHGAEIIFSPLLERLNLPMKRYPLFTQLVIARLINPTSKRQTAVFLQKKLGSGFTLDQIYYLLDVIYKKRTDIQNALSSYISNTYPSAMNYLLYDVTTLYFEKDDEDPDVESGLGLRKRGYSKDHRNDLPQVVLGLCVNELGMPLSYRLYPGNTYEGTTLGDGIKYAKNKAGARSMTVVADAGMLSKKNLDIIRDSEMKFIVSARIKNLNANVTRQITDHDFVANPIMELDYNGDRLVIAYSRKRAAADRARRKKSIARLEGLIASNRAVRKHQFLKIPLRGNPSIDAMAVERASQFDGLKGYLTNDFELSQDKVIEHYSYLPNVEQSFRMFKSDLRVRPMFHQVSQRIEAHVVLCMACLCLMRILEQKVKPLGYTYKQALSIITDAHSVLIGNTKKTYLIPPLLSNEFKAIQQSLEIGE